MNIRPLLLSSNSLPLFYGKPDYQASAMVISESHGVMKMMAITNEAGSDDGRPQTLGLSEDTTVRLPLLPSFLPPPTVPDTSLHTND